MKKKCLIFFTVGIGDSLMVTPALENLRPFADEFEFDALVMSSPIKDILSGNEFFNKIHFIDFLNNSSVKSFSEIIKLRKEKYDISILVFPSNHFKYQIVNFLLGGKQRYSFEYYERTFPELYFLSQNRIKEDRNTHAVENNYRLFEFALGIELKRTSSMKITIDEETLKFADKFISDNFLENKTIIGIHAGSDVFKNMVNKRWSFQKYGDLANKFSVDEFHILLFGGKSEYKLNDKIKNISPENSTVVKDTNFLQSCSLINKCQCFISGDTGLMHTAAALQVPSVNIFGPTNSIYTEPYKAEHIVTKKDHDCIPCYEYSRIPLICNQDKKYKCLENISIDDVYENIIKIIN
ncbi:MAG: glycosyltransferase family 9 protein, partial [Candidatus Delongbacteria bacterium]|nr:glycosyltransferase family 9 protein [Candidatus Delongbacteria bacterium]